MKVNEYFFFSFLMFLNLIQRLQYNNNYTNITVPCLQ